MGLGIIFIVLFLLMIIFMINPIKLKIKKTKSKILLEKCNIFSLEFHPIYKKGSGFHDIRLNVDDDIGIGRRIIEFKEINSIKIKQNKDPKFFQLYDITIKGKQ